MQTETRRRARYADMFGRRKALCESRPPPCVAGLRHPCAALEAPWPPLSAYASPHDGRRHLGARFCAAARENTAGGNEKYAGHRVTASPVISSYGGESEGGSRGSRSSS
eukprot:4364793-Prymnesium_polylepis.1